MLFTDCRFNFRPVFPDNNMSQHDLFKDEGGRIKDKVKRVLPSSRQLFILHPPSSSCFSFAPLSRDVMAKVEESSQSRLNQKRRRGSSHKPERRFVVYFIPQNRAIRIRCNNVPVPALT